MRWLVGGGRGWVGGARGVVYRWWWVRAFSHPTDTSKLSVSLLLVSHRGSIASALTTVSTLLSSVVWATCTYTWWIFCNTSQLLSVIADSYSTPSLVVDEGRGLSCARNAQLLCNQCDSVYVVCMLRVLRAFCVCIIGWTAIERVKVQHSSFGIDKGNSMKKWRFGKRCPPLDNLSWKNISAWVNVCLSRSFGSFQHFYIPIFLQFQDA